MAITNLMDEDGESRDNQWGFQQPSPAPTPSPSPQQNDSNNFDAASWVKDQSQKAGVSVEASDIAALQGKNPEDREQFMRDLQAQYDRRNDPTDGRPFDSQSSYYDQRTNQLTSAGQAAAAALPARPGALGAQASSASGPRYNSPNVGAQFSDPITSWIEQFAQQRAQQRENPPAGSGQALLEQALRDISAQFQKGGFTPNEQEVFQTQALDPLEQLRSARKQQVLQQLSVRNIDPRSGVGMQMLADVDRQFDGLRAQTQRSIAAQGAQETQSRMASAIQLLSALSQGENARLNEAFQYRTVPLNLADRSFNQASQLYNMAGNPLTLAQPLASLANMQDSRADSTQEMLGYLAAILANQN